MIADPSTGKVYRVVAMAPGYAMVMRGTRRSSYCVGDVRKRPAGWEATHTSGEWVRCTDLKLTRREAVELVIERDRAAFRGELSKEGSE